MGYASSRTVVCLVFILFQKHFSPQGEFIISSSILWVKTLRPDIVDVIPGVNSCFLLLDLGLLPAYQVAKGSCQGQGSNRLAQGQLGEVTMMSMAGHLICSIINAL